MAKFSSDPSFLTALNRQPTSVLDVSAATTAGGGAADSTAIGTSVALDGLRHGLVRQLHMQSNPTQVAALPLAIPLLAGVSVADILAVGVAAWAGAKLLNNAAGAQQAITHMTHHLGQRLEWTGQQLSVARNELSRVLNTVSEQGAIGALGHAIQKLQQQFSARPAPENRPVVMPTRTTPSSPATAVPVSMRSTVAGSGTPLDRQINQLLIRGSQQPTTPYRAVTTSPKPAQTVTTTAPAIPGAVHQAVQAIQHWAAAVRQLQSAEPAQRPLFESMVMSAGQTVQQALSHPEIRRVMQAGSGGGNQDDTASSATTGAASPTPNGRDPRNDEKLRQRLIEAMINVGGSLGGDALEHVTGGRPLSADRMGWGAVIAASLGFVLPPGVRGLVKGSFVNGLGSVAETGLRQLSGVDPHDPVAILASFVFTTGATAGLRGVGRFFRRPPAVSSSEAPKTASKPKPRVGTLELPFAVVPPPRPDKFDLAAIPSDVLHRALRILERQAPSWSPRYLRLADGLFERMFKALKGLGTDGYSDYELIRITSWMNSVEPNTFPPNADNFEIYRNTGMRKANGVLESQSLFNHRWRKFLPHDHHLFFGGFGKSPAANRLLPGRGGESGLYARLTAPGKLLVTLDVDLSTLRGDVLALFDEELVKWPARTMLGIRENLIQRVLEPLPDDPHFPQINAAERRTFMPLLKTGNLHRFPENFSFSPALSRAIKEELHQSGFLADRRYADRYTEMLSPDQLRKQDLEAIFNHLAWRAKHDMGPLPLESVVAELQMTQAYPAFRAELAREAGGKFDPHAIINMVDFYRYYAKAYDAGQLISVEDVKALLDKHGIPYYSATYPKSSR